mgnify:CR=1 FL=1
MNRRPDMAPGCNEKNNWDFIEFIVTTYFARKKKLADRCQALQSKGSEKMMIYLRVRDEIQRFLEKVKIENK